jgi:hypothetical protein
MGQAAIDSKLRGCDVVALKVEDIAPNGYAIDRATVRQKKTGQPVKFELTEQTRQAVDDYLRGASRKPAEFLPRAAVRQCSKCGTCRGTNRWMCCKAIFKTPSYFAIMRVLDCCRPSRHSSQ